VENGTLRPIPFKESNVVFTAPAGMKDCDPLPAFRGEDEQGAYIYSRWELTKAEIEDIVRTGILQVWVYGAGLPPMAFAPLPAAFA
jgi:hypothetical protein